MDRQSDNHDETGRPADKDPLGGKRRRKKILIIAASLLVMLSAALLIGHRYIVGWAVGYGLGKMGIQARGFETFELDPWDSEVVVGPVEFWAGDQRHGKVGRIGFGYDLIQLIHRKAFIRHLFFEGVDIHVDRQPDGSVTIDGIMLEKFFAADAQPSETSDTPWGFGVDSVQLRQSRIIFSDYTGGSLTIDTDQLTMEGFRSWEPDNTGTFVLNGRINDIQYEFEGTASVFSPDKYLTVRSKVEDGTLAKLVQFIGPVGITDRSGVFSVSGRHELTLFQDKRILVESDSRLEFRDADMTGEGLDQLQLKSGAVHLDTRLSIEPDGKNNLQGSIEASGAAFFLKDGRGLSLSVGRAEIATSDMDIDIQTGKNKGLGQVYRTVRADSTTAMPLVDLFVALMEAIAAELADDEFSARGAIALNVDQVKLSIEDEKNALGLQVDVDTWKAGASDVAVDSLPPKMSAAGRIETTLGGMAGDIRLPESTTVFSSEQAKVIFEKYQGRREKEAIEVDVTGSTELKAAKVALNPGGEQAGQEVSADLLSVRYDDLNVNKIADSAAFKGRIELSADLLESHLSDALAMAVEKAGLNLQTLQGKADKTSVVITLGGAVDLIAPKIQLFGQDRKKSVDLRSQKVHAGFQQLQADVGANQIAMSGTIDTLVSNLLLELPGDSGKATKLTAKGLKAALPSLKISVGGEDTSIGFRTRAKLTESGITLPDAPGMPEISLSAGSIELPAGEFKALFGSKTSWQAVSDAAVESLSAGLDRGDSGRLRIEKLTASHLETDHHFSLAVGELRLNGLDADLSDRTFTAFGADDPGGAQAAPADAVSTEQPQMRAGRVVIGKRSRVAFTDGSVAPPIKTELRINEFDLGGFDTAAPAKHTRLKIDATLNDSAKLKINGWATPLHAEPDFELALSAEGVKLPDYSAYAAKLAGLSIATGGLSAQLKAKAARKKLDGQLQLTVRNLDIGPVSKAAADQLGKTYDSPVDFAVALLEDREGVIALEFPLSGTTDKPVLDFSTVINQAVQHQMTGLTPEGSGLLFEPVVFQPGSERLDDPQRVQLDRIGDLMQRKPRLSIRLCGRATSADISAFQEGEDEAGSAENATSSEDRRVQSDPDRPAPEAENGVAGGPRSPTREERNRLIDLARQRSSAVRSYLAEDRQIPIRRLAECEATVDLQDDQPPRVDLLP